MYPTLKPIFHQKTGLRWVPDANEISTKNMKCTCPTQRPNARDLTQPIFHWKWGLRLLPNAKKSTHKNEMYMANARNWRHLTQKIPKCWYFFALGDAKVPDSRYFAFWWNIGVTLYNLYYTVIDMDFTTLIYFFQRSLNLLPVIILLHNPLPISFYSITYVTTVLREIICYSLEL